MITEMDEILEERVCNALGYLYHSFTSQQLAFYS